MKYYSLTNSTDEKEIGKIWPQCDSVPDGYNYNELLKGPNSMINLTNSEFPNMNPNLVFGLHKKAKLTDVISTNNISAIGLLVNKKVKNILESFNLMAHQFYPAIVKESDFQYKYYWLHLVKPDLLGINFKKSKFEITNLVNKPISNINIDSWDHFMERKKTLTFKHIRAKKISLEPEAQKDLIYFPYIYSYMLINENLALEMASQKITGLEISEQNILI